MFWFLDRALDLIPRTLKTGERFTGACMLVFSSMKFWNFNFSAASHMFKASISSSSLDMFHFQYQDSSLRQTPIIHLLLFYSTLYQFLNSFFLSCELCVTLSFLQHHSKIVLDIQLSFNHPISIKNASATPPIAPKYHLMPQPFRFCHYTY